MSRATKLIKLTFYKVMTDIITHDWVWPWISTRIKVWAYMNDPLKDEWEEAGHED